MKRIILSISIILFFYSCNSGGSSSVGPDVEPVYTVNMGLSGVGSNFAADPEAQGSFIDALAVQLGISFNRIQIVNITTQRGSVNIELLFLESLDSSEPSVSNILDNIADTIEENNNMVGGYGVAEIEIMESSSAQSAEYILQAANTELGNILEQMFDCDGFYDPVGTMTGNDYASSEIYDCNDDLDENDFSPAYDLYLEALLHDPSSPGANFGAGITEMLSITNDPILEEFFEEWDDWGDDNIAVSEDNGFGRVTSGLPVGANAFLMPNSIDFTSFLPLDYLLKNFVNKQPSEHSDGGRDGESIISDMIDVIDNVFITRLTNSINYLGNATGQGFVFEVTPQMQDNEDQNSLDFDDTEIHLLKASMHALRFMLYSMTAYDLDVGADAFNNDDIHDFSFLDPESDFLTLRDGKENYFPNAHADITNMLTSLTAAYNFLANDNFTSNDITLWEDISGDTVEVESLTGGLDYEIDLIDFIRPQPGGYIYDIFNSDTFIEECDSDCNDWSCDGCCDWEEDCWDVIVNLGNFMTDPPSNLKEILPDYSISTSEEVWLEYQEENSWSEDVLDLSSCLDQITNECNPTSDGSCMEDHHSDWDIGYCDCSGSWSCEQGYINSENGYTQSDCENLYNGVWYDAAWHGSHGPLISQEQVGTPPSADYAMGYCTCSDDCSYITQENGYDEWYCDYYYDGVWIAQVGTAPSYDYQPYQAGCTAIEDYLELIYDSIEAEVTDNNSGDYIDHGYCGNYDDFTWGGRTHVELQENLGSGNFEVSFHRDYSGCWLDYEYEPCLDWSTDDFSAWKLDWDVTFGGLFPHMQAGPFFSDFLSIDQDDWDEDINDSECLDF